MHYHPIPCDTHTPIPIRRSASLELSNAFTTARRKYDHENAITNRNSDADDTQLPGQFYFTQTLAIQLAAEQQRGLP